MSQHAASIDALSAAICQNLCLAREGWSFDRRLFYRQPNEAHAAAMIDEGAWHLLHVTLQTAVFMALSRLADKSRIGGHATASFQTLADRLGNTAVCADIANLRSKIEYLRDKAVAHSDCELHVPNRPLASGSMTRAELGECLELAQRITETLGITCGVECPNGTTAGDAIMAAIRGVHCLQGLKERALSGFSLTPDEVLRSCRDAGV